jgi:hypothetical protein
MQKTRQIFNIFLASPSDVTEERAALDVIVDGINRRLGPRLGWHIELHKWEDIPPAIGRPQEIINKAVDSCDLFIALLWKRWGEPTGTYSSGFEEEFERAKELNKKHGRPEIWLFFKAVDSETLKDPGTQLSNVLKFRALQTELKELLFQELRDAEEWKIRVEDWLFDHVLEIGLAKQSTQAKPVIAVPTLEPGIIETQHSGDMFVQTDTPGQLAIVSSLLSRAIERGDLEFSRDGENLLREFDVARLFLLSATWMSRRYTGNVIGIHEMNLLYKHRNQLDLTVAENFQLFRAVVADADDVVPGWFWHFEFSPDTIENLLLDRAISDSEVSVRSQALQILTDARISIPYGTWGDIPINDESMAVRAKAYDYLARVGNADALSLLENIPADKTDLSGVWLRETRLRLLARLDPSKALSDVIADSEYISEKEAQALSECLNQVTEETLLPAAESPLEKVRLVSLGELARRGRVPEALAQRLIRDPSLEIRAIALESLASSGTLPEFQEVRSLLSRDDSAGAGSSSRLSEILSFTQRPEILPNPDPIFVSFYLSQDTQTILKDVDWFSINGPLAYRALASGRFAEVSQHIRSDIRDGFRRIRDESVERMIAKYGRDLWEQEAGAFHKYDESTRSSFTEAALLGLAAHGQPSDADIARSYLSQGISSLRDASVAVICKFGGAEDVDVLMKISEEAWGEMRRSAAAAALKFSSHPVETARRLLKNNDPQIVKAVLSWLFRQDCAEVRSMFESSLRDEDANSRVRGTYYCSKWMNEDQLKQLLSDYSAEGTYFYDVVTWLDRLLYSPPTLRAMFKLRLKQKANDSDDLSN